MSISSNPFCYTEPVSLANDQVYVPDSNVPRIVNDLLSHQCCLIIGPPASGTTSTLLAVGDAYRKRLPEATWWYIDFKQMPADDIASLFAALAKEGADLFPDQVPHWSKADSERAFRRALILSIASIRRPLVLAIDHIESAPVRVAQTVVREVRSLYSRRDEPGALQKFISVVLAGSRGLRRQGEGRGSPLNFACIHYIQDLRPKDAVQMLLSAGEGQLWHFEVGAAQYLAEATNGDKYLLQRLGYDCVESLMESGGKSITLDLAQKVVADFAKAGFRDDPQLSQLLPSLVQDEEALDIILDLLKEPAIQVSLARMLRANISPKVARVFKQKGNSVIIRNDIYQHILLEHKHVLEVVRAMHRSAQQRVLRTRRLQRLISQAEIALAGKEALRSTLTEIRDFMHADDVHLFVYDETRHQLAPNGSTSDRIMPSTAPVLSQGRFIEALQNATGCVRCQAVVRQCLSDKCLGSQTADCIWAPLIERHATRMVGALALVGQPLVMPPQWEKDLLELSIILADNLQRWRYLLGFQKLARIRVDLPYDEVKHEICEVTSFLLNKPFAFLWQGDVNWSPLLLRAAVGVQQKHYAELGLMSNEALQHLNDPDPRTLLVSPDQRSNAPIPPDVISSIGLDHLLLVGFQMQDNQISVLGIGASDLWQPTDMELALAQLIARQATVILANLDAYHQIQQRLETSRLSARLLSHELNRWPAAIAEELELLLGGLEGPMTPSQCEKLERVQGYMERHQQLIQKLLDIARFDAGTFRARMSTQFIRPVLDDVLNRLAPEVEAAGMHLAVDLEPELPSHRLDATLIDRIMTNLVQNAVQYAAQGTVRVRAWADEGGTVVAVEDEGPGVPLEFRELIFQPWHRGKYSQHIAGRGDNLGLGLYFAQKLMELHGGCVEYDDNYSGGARFILAFPKLEGGARQ